MICPKCRSKWKIIRVPNINLGVFTIPLPGSHKRNVCSKCGYIDSRDMVIGFGAAKEYIGPDDSERNKVIEESRLAEEFYNKKVMPCCHRPLKFFDGPQCGINMNITCAYEDCGVKWNISRMVQSIERIGGHSKDVLTDQLFQRDKNGNSKN